MKLFYIIDDQFWNYFEYSKKVKDVKIDANAPFIESNLEITFEDDTKVNLKAECSRYFCPVEFEDDKKC